MKNRYGTVFAEFMSVRAHKSHMSGGAHNPVVGVVSLARVHHSIIISILALGILVSSATAARGDVDAIMRRMNAPKNSVWLDSLDLSASRLGWGRAKMSNTGGPLMMQGTIYPHGIGAFPTSALVLDLNGAARRFAASAGVDDLAGSNDPVVFEIWVDGEKKLSSAKLRKGDKPEAMEVDLTGAKRLFLIVQPVEGSSNVPANWGGALLLLDPDAKTVPAVGGVNDEPAAAIAHTDFNQIGIHGPRVVGATPGRPFLFKVPASGKPPLSFAANGLPAGLALDTNTGIITGSLAGDGETVVAITVTDSAGATARRNLTIFGGRRKLALTPPMGWNSWNVWGTSVDEAKVRAAADAMSDSGLAAFGYQFINIDDAWEADRDENGYIRTNKKFPDMKALADYVHSKGLKLGIYSSPGPKTCAGYEGSYKYEQEDADKYAEWGIDYLKYDWCAYRLIAENDSLPELMKPYHVMRAALDNIDRDIVYSLCQYGMGQVWTWGADVGGNLWRTTGDITDNWGSMSGIGFSQNTQEPYAGPGRWNDPDMLVVGRVGWGPSLRATGLTPNEQITHITLWSILAAPLLTGCDMSQIDTFTVDLMTNTEVIDVNQDPMGRQGRLVARDGMLEVWARPLFDGTTAVALFNRFFEKSEITVNWTDIGIEGAQPVRDLWQRRDLGNFTGSFTTAVPAHGATLLKIGAPGSAAQ